MSLITVNASLTTNGTARCLSMGGFFYTRAVSGIYPIRILGSALCCRDRKLSSAECIAKEFNTDFYLTIVIDLYILRIGINGLHRLYSRSLA